MSKAADIVELAVPAGADYYNFPSIHWQKIRRGSNAGTKIVL